MVGAADIVHLDLARRRRRRESMTLCNDRGECPQVDHSKWASLGLDRRILKALKRKQYNAPTAVQAQVIPLVLSGKDVVVRAHTGSGKTAAYLLPVAHIIMQNRAHGALPNPRAIVLVPTRELANQVTKEACSILCQCAPTLRAGELPASGCAPEILREFAGAPPEILVGTPARVVECIRCGFFPPDALNSGLDLLVLDEADMLLSFGYNHDIKCIAAEVQRGCQSILLSATTNEELTGMQSLVLHNPVQLDLGSLNRNRCGQTETNAVQPVQSPQISHYIIKLHTDDKLLYCMALFRLGLCEKKTLVFVSHSDAAIRLRLFLAKFSISCCALHRELPYNSRAHILQEYNRGVYDCMIAVADDISARTKKESEARDLMLDGKHLSASEEVKRLGRQKDAHKEFGVVRGIDFKQVRTVINFDVPSDASAYVHQIGRTGRGGEHGSAITFVSLSEVRKIEAIQQDLKEYGENGSSLVFKPFGKLAIEDVEALRYRAEDVSRTVGRASVRDARAREIRTELLNSDRLAAHFDENPDELILLKHDFRLAKQRALPHLNHLPNYLRGGKPVKRLEENYTGAGNTSALIEGKKKKMVPKVTRARKRYKTDSANKKLKLKDVFASAKGKSRTDG